MDTENLDENSQSKPVMLFGRDIRKIPCFKQSMLLGIYSGLASGLIAFMVTSRPKLSTKVALGSYMSISVIFWCYCRYNYVMQKYAVKDVQCILEQVEKKKQVDEIFQEQQRKLVDA